MKIFCVVFISVILLPHGRTHDWAANRYDQFFSHASRFNSEETDDTLIKTKIVNLEEDDSAFTQKEVATEEVKDYHQLHNELNDVNVQADDDILPGNVIETFLADLKTNLHKRYSHQHFIKHMFHKFKDRIAYLEDLVENNTSQNLDKDVKIILKSLQDEYEDNQLRGRLYSKTFARKNATSEYRRCLEQTPKFLSFVNAEYNIIENLVLTKDNEIPAHLTILAVVRNLTTTADTQRFMKIAHIGDCIFKTVSSVLGEAIKDDKKNNKNGRHQVHHYIKETEDNTKAAILTAIAFRTIKSSVPTALSFYHDSFTAVLEAIFENKKPAVQIAPRSKGLKLNNQLWKCLKNMMIANWHTLPDAKTYTLPSVSEFAVFVGRLRYFSFVLQCYLTIVEHREEPDQYTHNVTKYDVWNWYTNGLIQEMVIDSEDFQNDVYNDDSSDEASSHEIPDKDLKSRHFDKNHRLIIPAT